MERRPEPSPDHRPAPDAGHAPDHSLDHTPSHRSTPRTGSIRLLFDALVAVLAAFALLNRALGWWHPALDANWLWLGWASGPWGAVLLVVFGVAVLGWSRWRSERALATAARAVVALAAAGCAVDAVGFYRVLAAGLIESAVPVPLSLISALMLGGWALRPPQKQAGWRWVPAGALAGAIWVALLVGSLAMTNYARPADAIVVFGAAVWADGRPSDALADRTHTAIRLYQRGLAPVLVFSGGHGPGAPISEPEAMRRMAAAAGVPADAIVLDEAGLNTAATVANTAAMARARGWQAVMMVSHDYHCARIKLASARQGLVAYTVPAVEPQPLAKKAWFVARELVAFAWYWVHPAKTIAASDQSAKSAKSAGSERR